jgi:undecaprenyl-diphosphatase
VNQQDQGNAPGSAEEMLSPSAPGLPPGSVVAVDLHQVVPDVVSSTRLLVIVGAGTSLLLAAMTASAVAHASVLSTIDLQVHSWILVNRNDASIGLARCLTWGGATIVTLPALIVIGALASPRRGPLRSRIGSGMLLAGVASLGVYLGLLINASVGGVRPPEADWAATAGGPTFPSGHTTAATIFAAFVVWALIPHMRTTTQRAVLVSAAVAYAGTVGLTRVWLGVHWPTDVVGGWLFGIAWASLAAAAVLSLRRHWPRGAIRPVSDGPGEG